MTVAAVQCHFGLHNSRRERLRCRRCVTDCKFPVDEQLLVQRKCYRSLRTVRSIGLVVMVDVFQWSLLQWSLDVADHDQHLTSFLGVHISLCLKQMGLCLNFRRILINWF